VKISEVAVTGLFDTYDHTIPLNVGKRITIIHGPNGSGKTGIVVQ
jgi:DNA repair exonuclease SbcCD ATPase subunit